MAAVAEDKLTDDDLFAFTCTSGFSPIADSNPISTNPLAACIDSSTSSHYCPDRSKLINYQLISGNEIIAADGHALKALGVGHVCIALSNGSG